MFQIILLFVGDTTVTTHLTLIDLTRSREAAKNLGSRLCEPTNLMDSTP